MKCLRCNGENPENHKFCSRCGAKLERVCPQCGEPCPPEFRFCGQCGHALSAPADPVPKELSFDEKLDKIQRYLPRGLTEKILSQRDKIEGERRYVTVMFCDMQGFTSLVEKAGPEEAYGIMDRIYEILIHKVHDYEGTVNEMTGDGIMALFGAPIALEDAPERAIRSSLAIHREMSRFNDHEKSLGQTSQIRMRIGLHSGPVVVGTLGNNLRVEFKAVGDTVNLASRMEGLAEPGTTFVTHEIFSRTQGMFRFEALGEKKIKGKEAPVRVYRVIGSSARRTRFDISAERGLTRFVGRERELELLLEAFQRARDGHGQAMSIVAEAGVGKSRLLYEFRKAIASEDVAILEGQCVSYGANTPYLPIIDVLRDNFRIAGETTPDEIREKVTRGLNQLGADLNQTLPYFLDLLSLENGAQLLKDADPEIRRRKTFESLTEITLRGSQQRPLVMVIEDLHWVDKTSEEAIGKLLDHIAGAKVLMVFTFRSTYLPPWGGRSYYGQIHLNRLSRRESLRMIRSILDAEAVDEGLAEHLLKRTEGVPLFAEEFTRSLKESGAVADRDGRVFLKTDRSVMQIPGNIHDVLMARVDRLPEGAREILRVGSVIGREFSRSLLQEITRLSETELIVGLTQLRESEMLFERGLSAQATYLFQHAMIRELLYDSLLPARRSEYHRTIGLAMERLYSDRLGEHAPMLAVHFTQGKDYEKAYHYHHLAGDRAAASYANCEALEHFRESWKLAAEGSQIQHAAKRRVETALRLAEVMEPLGQFEPALALLNKALRDAEDLKDPAGKGNIHYWTGNILGNLGNYDEAREHLHTCLELCQGCGNRETEGNAHDYLSQLDYFQGYLKQALEHSETALACLREFVSPARLAWALAVRTVVLCDLKREDEYEAYLNEAEDWARGSANDRARCLIILRKSMNCVYLGRYEDGIALALEGVDLAEKIGDRIVPVMLLAYAGLGALWAGKTEYALELLQRGEINGRNVGHPAGLAVVRIYLAQAVLRSGRVAEARETVEKSLDFCRQLDLGVILKNNLEMAAEILANLHPADETRIEDMMSKAFALAERSESNRYWLYHWIAKARINHALGRIADARMAVAKARALYRELGVENATGEIWAIEEALEEANREGRN